MTQVESALQKGGSRDLQYDKSLLKTLTEKKIGGESGISVLYDEAKFKTARGKAGADEDLAAITKETNRKDRTATASSRRFRTSRPRSRRSFRTRA